MLILIILAVIVAIAVYVVSVYNGLVATKTRIGASIQEIGNQLKRQVDLIPNLETSAKTYLKHEKDTFTMLTSARKAVDAAVKAQDLDKMAQASDKIQNLLGGLKVIVESNPEIKGAEVIRQLMDELRDTADKVMYSRRTLIDLTADYNVQIVSFPSSFIAGAFGFKAETGLAMPAGGDHLKVSADDLKTPKVNFD